MTNCNLNALDPKRFFEIPAMREKNILSASEEHSAEKPANRLAKRLHPARQFLRISEVLDHGNGCKSYILVPNAARGTSECAYFSAGQYLSVLVNIGEMRLTRPYSISSSPAEALAGQYRITVKAVEGGIASRYIIDNWSVGGEVEVSEPCGVFTYEPLRDAPHIVGIAGGSGITPFLSLAKAISDGDEDCSLTLLYGSRTWDGIICRDELDALCAGCDRLRAIYVLSDEQREGCPHGSITAELISEFAPDRPYSVFVCGSQDMYRHIGEELPKLGLERKFIRFECFGELHGTQHEAPESVSMTVTQRGEKRTLRVSTSDTVLRSLEKSGIAAPSRCRSGECGFCHTVLLSGEVYIPPQAEHRRLADERYGRIHSCCSFPVSDIEIELPAAK